VRHQKNRSNQLLKAAHWADRGIASERPSGFKGTVGPSPASASIFFGNPDDSFANAVVDEIS
jgi:hypothetical protein